MGYRLYARYLGERVFDDRAEEGFVVPSVAHRDDVDFVPTDRHVLFGHHFTSIAGAAPIIGPCVAAYWGYAPALLWVVFGTIFMGAAHDFGALVASTREGGRSVADLAGVVIGPRARLMFLCFVVVLVWLVLAVFAMAIAGLFVALPSSVLPVQIEIVIALVIGLLIHKRRLPLLIPSLIALAVLYLFVYLGTLYPIDLADFGVAPAARANTWIVFLFGYSAIASVLPVWLLLQPRDFINSHQLFVGLGLLFLGLFVAHPELDAPAFRAPGDGAPDLFPVLFVTVACGAISGFHGLVSSGTTSKQLASMKDARFIGYGSMLGEGTLALASTLAAVSGIALVTECQLPGQGAVTDLSWGVYYDTWAHAGANKAAAFVLGGGAFLEALGMPSALARTLMAVLVISFAATTLDTATRIQRLIVGELGTSVGVSALKNKYLGTVVAVVPAVALAFGKTSDGAGAKALGWALWPVFGASNQMLAALTLLVLTLYFRSRGKRVVALMVPMVLVAIVAVLAIVSKLRAFLHEGNSLLAGISALMLALILWMCVEGALAFRRQR